MESLPIPVATQSKTWVFDRLFAGTASSNPVGTIGVFLFECCVF